MSFRSSVASVAFERKYGCPVLINIVESKNDDKQAFSATMVENARTRQEMTVNEKFKLTTPHVLHYENGNPQRTGDCQASTTTNAVRS